MATAGRVGMGLIMRIIMVRTITAVFGDRMLMCSDITIIGGTIMILPIEGSRAARLGADFTEGEDLHTAGAAVTEAAGMADDMDSKLL